MENRIKNLGIVFSSTNKAYYSGQLLSGELRFDTDEEITLLAINIQFIGQAEVYWREYDQVSYNHNETTRENVIECCEIYVNKVLNVAGANGPCILPCGSHEYLFNFLIPEKAPSSFKGSKGNVNYKVIANIERPNVNTAFVKETVNVIAPLDLNTIPEIKNPIVLEFEEVYSCLCTFDPIKLSIRLPLSGYCPGQYIPIELAAVNDSVIEVKEIIFQLNQRECYHNKTRGSSFEEPPKLLAKVVFGSILMKTNNVYEVRLKIPDILPSNLINCNIIDVGYTLNVTIKLTGCMDDDQDETEICLGLVPLSGFQDDNYIHPLTHLLPNLTPQNFSDITSNDEVDFKLTSPNNVANVFPQPGINEGYVKSTPMLSLEPVAIGFDVVTPAYNPEFKEGICVNPTAPPL